MLLSMMCTTAMATENASLIVTGVTGGKIKPADEFTATVTVPKATTAIASGKVKVVFNNTVLTALEIQVTGLEGSFTKQITEVANANTNGWYSVSFGSSTGNNVTMTENLVLKAKFKVNDVAAATYSNLLEVDTSPSNYYFADQEDTTVDPATFPAGGNTFSATVPKAPISSVSATVAQPVKGYPLDTSVSVPSAAGYTADVMWKADNMTVTGDAQADTVYTALITLTAKEGESFSSSLNNTTTPGGYSIEWLNSTELLLTKEFEKTNLKDATGITIDNTTLTVAVPKAEPNTEQKAELPLTAKVNYDDGTYETVDASWSFVDPKPEGVDFEEGGKLTVTNKAAGGDVKVKAAYNGMTATETVTITKEPAKEAKIVLTAPGSTTIDVPTGNGVKNNSGKCTAKVYDQYGMPITSAGVTYESDPATMPTGVTFASTTGEFFVDNTAQNGTVKVIAKYGTVASNPVAFTIKRAAGTVNSVTLSGSDPTLTVPEANGPENPKSKTVTNTYTATVKDQFGVTIPGESVSWSVSGNAGVTINSSTGDLTISSNATADSVTITATCKDKSDSKTVSVTRTTPAAKWVKITGQNGSPAKTQFVIPAATGAISETSNSYEATVYDQYGKDYNENVDWSLYPSSVNGVTKEVSTTNTNVVTIKVDSNAIEGNFDIIATSSSSSAVNGKINLTLTNKTPASVTTAPTAKTNLKYNGNDQALVNEGVADGGTMQYSLNGTDWTNTVPKGKNAGDYTVYYKVVGDSGHTDYTPASNTVSVSIAQKEVTVSDITVANKAYDGGTNATVNASGATFDGKVDGDTLTITATGTFANADVDNGKTVNLTLGTLSGASAGNYKLAATGNQTTTTADITQATLTVTPVANQSKKFKEADPALTYNYSGNVSGQTPAFNGALSRAEGEDVGQYDITLGNLTLKDNGNFKASNYELKMVSSAVKFEIKKADAPAAPTGLKGYKDSALSTVTLPTGWSWVDGTLKMDTIGDQIFKANYAGDTNHEAGTNVDVTVKVVQKSSGGYYYAPTAAVVPDMPMLYRGCTGDAVKTLQDKLNALGYNSGNVDGIFGAKTYAAVTAFQKANSLGVDGIVGKLTWGKLYGVSPAMPVETTTVVGRPMVSYGSRGDAVRKLQELLNALGYDCGSVDGIFGSKTKAAVLAFQKANGLGVDGIVGPLTWAKLG